MGTIVMETILFMLTVMSVCVLLCAIAFSLKEIKECIKCKKLHFNSPQTAKANRDGKFLYIL